MLMLNAQSLMFSIWIYFKVSFIPEMQSWIFSIITPVLSVTWSFRIHSEMLLKKHFILSMLKIVLLIIFVETVIYIFDEYDVQNNSMYLKQ